MTVLEGIIEDVATELYQKLWNLNRILYEVWHW